MKRILYMLLIMSLIFSDIINTSSYDKHKLKEIENNIDQIKPEQLNNILKIIKPRVSKYIKKYSVKEWDNLYKISKFYDIKINTIKNINWENVKNLYPKEKIYITLLDWLIHTTNENESIEDIAQMYKISEKEIYKYNKFLNYWETAWNMLFIHNWILFEESWKELLTKHSIQLEYVNNENKFIRWHCTWFVSKYKNINWRWNAKDWLQNAKDANNPVWEIPKKWSIIVFHWKWYNKEHWHVWIVFNVLKDELIIWDMNYHEINKVTYRKINKNDDAILWYIY